MPGMCADSRIDVLTLSAPFRRRPEDLFGRCWIPLKVTPQKKDDQNQPNNRQKVKALPPAFSIDIGQAPPPYGNARQKCRDAKSPRQVVDTRLKSKTRHNREEKPPPKFRPRRAAVEIRIL